MEQSEGRTGKFYFFFLISSQNKYETLEPPKTILKILQENPLYHDGFFSSFSFSFFFQIFIF